MLSSISRLTVSRLLAAIWLAVLVSAGGCQQRPPVASDEEGDIFASILEPITPKSPGEVARDAFNTYDPDLRRQSITRLAMADFGGEQPYLRLYRLVMDDPDPTVRAACVRALGMHGEVDDARLVAVRLDDTSPYVRWEAARALQRLYHPEVIAALAKALAEDDDPDVRIAAADALGQYAYPHAFQALVVGLADPNFTVVLAARQSLSTLIGQDLGADPADWLTWAEQQGDQMFAGRQPYTQRTYAPRRSWMQHLMIWDQPATQ